MANDRDAVRIARRVEFWQKRLSPLGVDHWRIDGVHFVDEPSGGRNRAAASVRPSVHYDHCEFWFAHDFVDECNPRDLDITIIHEWLHVAMRNLDNSIESAEEMLGSSTQDIWVSRVNHERENLIDRLSRIIYVLWEAEARATPAAIRRSDRASLRLVP